MKKLILKVALKYGLILGIIFFVSNLISTINFNPENVPPIGESFSLKSFSLIVILQWGLMIACLAMAHYEYNKKNEHYLPFKDSIFIGLIILGISYIISTLLFDLSGYDLIMKEKMHLFQSNLSGKLSEKYGTNITENMFSTSTIDKIIQQVVVFLIQIILLFILITYESRWKIFKKCGKEGWASIVPIYSIVVWLEIVKKPVWWLALLLIPFVNIVLAITMVNLLSMRFRKNGNFTVGLIFLPFIFYPLLGLSKAECINE